MKSEIKLFSHLRYKLGKDILLVEVLDRMTVRDLKLRIKQLGGSKILNIPFRVAVNGNFVTDDFKIEEADEIALIPPVQGG